MFIKPILNVPFLPDERYVDFLIDCAEDLDSVHFGLLHSLPLDSRIRIEPPVAQEEIIDGLSRLQGPRKYALLNSRFYTPELLTDQNTIKPVIRTLEQYVNRGVIDGIIYCDHYLLQVLSDQAPELAAQLEAVPSANTMLDSCNKIEAQLAYIGETRFKLPGKIVLDRSLNRNLDDLARIALKMHQNYPGMKMESLANEGCLPYCPFKLAHDSYIALANMGGTDQTHVINCDIGCIRLLDEQPHRLLQSPFIRPEDIDLYLFHVDTIKLCGRTLGADFLMNTIRAYRARRYDGNLLDLMDTMSWLAERLYVDNRSLSFDFANMLSQCDNRCDSCGFCKELFESISHPLPLSIPNLRATVD